MPAGSNISLDRVTQEQVLKNIRNAASSSLKKIKALAADINTTDLSEFLAESGIPISDLYKTRSSNQYSWTRLVRETENIDAPEAFVPVPEQDRTTEEDRKSTRLNSSHVATSYAVFFLKKKRYQP